ncbi:hypothetical protein CDES_09890 [Corynebacterium deserti GIMN1.010]|uniref:DUF2029 domain-containing protein n=1 Tax=Corynebacterium deserti GIMN1.010 TaxID=931089 RepID=A0A0M3Q9Y5_9CORY|nr:glycosyltransferase 87 family protein [Corynebacterium deserti]ALC06363.1 hypothetical protein CDES_09890 [Corynebacterium deserti GIMN1.010]
MNGDYVAQSLQPLLNFKNTKVRGTLITLATIALALTLWPSIFNVRAIESFVFFFHIDTDVYRAGARAFLDGQNLYTQDYQVGGIQLPFTYPPISAALFVPLAILPSNVAGTLLTLISAGLLWWCVAIVLRRVFKTLDDADCRLISYLILPVALSTEPVFQTIQFGQINIILMTFVLMDTFTKKPWLPRGFWIGLAASIKLTPAVFGLYFLVKKDWKGAGVAIASGVGFSALAFFLSPASSKIYWTETLNDPSRIGNLSYVANQSMRGVLSRLMHENQELVEKLWLVAVALCLIGVAVAMGRAVKAGNAHGAVLLNSLIALFCSPVSWSHHWVWLIPIVLGLAASAWSQRTTAPSTAATAGVLAMLGTIPMFITTFWTMPYDSESYPMWPLILQPSGNAYVVFAIVLIIVGLINPGIFGNATPSTKRISPVLAGVVALIVFYLLANIWFKGNDRNQALFQYPVHTLNSRGLTDFGEVLVGLFNGNSLASLWIVGALNLAAVGWTVWFLLRRFTTLKSPLVYLSVLTATLMTFAVQDALQFGSLTMLACAIITTDLLSRRPVIARGLLTGFAAALCGWPLLMVVGFVIARRYSAVLVSVGTAAVLCVLGILLNPGPANLDLFRLWFSGRDGRDNLSFYAFIARWISEAPAWMFVWAIVGLILGVWAIHRTYIAGRRDLSTALTIAVPVIVLPTVELHHLVLLIPLVAVLLRHGYFTIVYLLAFVFIVSWTPQHLSYSSVFPLNDPAPEGYVAHFGWYLLVEPMAVAPAAIILGVYVACGLLKPLPLQVAQSSPKGVLA